MSCNAWFRLTWGLHRQTTRQPKKGFLIVAAAGPVLLHGDVLFNVTLAVLIQSLVTLSYLSGGSIAFDQNRTDQPCHKAWGAFGHYYFCQRALDDNSSVSC